MVGRRKREEIKIQTHLSVVIFNRFICHNTREVLTNINGIWMQNCLYVIAIFPLSEGICSIREDVN